MVTDADANKLDEVEAEAERLLVVIVTRRIGRERNRTYVEPRRGRANDLLGLFARQPARRRLIDDARRDLRREAIEVDVEVDLRDLARDGIECLGHVAQGLSFVPGDDVDRGALKPLPFGFRGEVPDAKQRDCLLLEWRAVAGLAPIIPVAVAGDDCERHSWKEAAGRRLGCVEVGVSVDPHRAAVGVVKPGENADAGVAGASQDKRQCAHLVRARDGGGELFVHGRGRRGGVAKGTAAIDALDADGEAVAA